MFISGWVIFINKNGCCILLKFRHTVYNLKNPHGGYKLFEVKFFEGESN